MGINLNHATIEFADSEGTGEELVPLFGRLNHRLIRTNQRLVRVTAGMIDLPAPASSWLAVVNDHDNSGKSYAFFIQLDYAESGQWPPVARKPRHPQLKKTKVKGEAKSTKHVPGSADTPW